MDLEISPAELAVRLRGPDSPHLLDVREFEENQYVALPGSTLLPLGELEGRMGEIEKWKEEEVVIYCHHGIRSLRALATLRQAGFKRLKNLSGGIGRWTDEVDPTLPRY